MSGALLCKAIDEKKLSSCSTLIIVERHFSWGIDPGAGSPKNNAAPIGH